MDYCHYFCCRLRGEEWGRCHLFRCCLFPTPFKYLFHRGISIERKLTTQLITFLQWWRHWAPSATELELKLCSFSFFFWVINYYSNYNYQLNPSKILIPKINQVCVLLAPARHWHQRVLQFIAVPGGCKLTMPIICTKIHQTKCIARQVLYFVKITAVADGCILFWSISVKLCSAAFNNHDFKSEFFWGKLFSKQQQLCAIFLLLEDKVHS